MIVIFNTEQRLFTRRGNRFVVNIEVSHDVDDSEEFGTVETWKYDLVSYASKPSIKIVERKIHRHLTQEEKDEWGRW